MVERDHALVVHEALLTFVCSTTINGYPENPFFCPSHLVRAVAHVLEELIQPLSLAVGGILAY